MDQQPTTGQKSGFCFQLASDVRNVMAESGFWTLLGIC